MGGGGGHSKDGCKVAQIGAALLRLVQHGLDGCGVAQMGAA